MVERRHLLGSTSFWPLRLVCARLIERTLDRIRAASLEAGRLLDIGADFERSRDSDRESVVMTGDSLIAPPDFSPRALRQIL